MTRTGWIRRLAPLAAITIRLTPAVGQETPADTSETTTVQAPGAGYAAGGLHNFLLGREYRELWTAPITLPVLDLEHFAGGIRAVSRTGGQQSKSLRLQAPDGRQFFFRSIDKDPVGALPPELRQTVAASVLRDQTSSALPTAPVVVDRLLTAAGILHDHPFLIVLPDDDRLGEFRADFAGLMGTLEERVGGSGPAAHWGGAEEIILSDTLFARLNRSADDQVDARAFLRARLFDVLIGDWDRHRDQWRWARFGDSVPRLWKPIPLDRDQAFAKYDGLLLAIARQTVFQLTNFKDSYPKPIGAAWNGRDLDRRLLTGLSRADWEEVAGQLRAALTDSVIQDAVAALPPEHRELIGAQLVKWIQLRRDGVEAMAQRYYRLLADVVDVTTTDQADLAVVTRASDTVEMTVARLETPDAPWYRRRFAANETSDLRVFLRDGNDSVVVSGDGGGPTVRILGGEGDDRLVNSATGGRNRFYDDSSGAGSTLGKPANVDRRPYVLPPPKTPTELPPRDWGHRWQQMIWASYGPDLGFFIGAGLTRVNYGFRELPFASRHRLRAGFATGPGSYRVDYRGEWHREDSRVTTVLLLRASGIDVDKFHGFGNEVSAPEDEEFYRVTQDAYTAAPLLELPVGRKGTLSIGPFMKYVSTDDRPNRYLATVNPYGVGNFGELGMGVGYLLDTRNRIHAASRGATLQVIGRVLPAWWDVQETFGTLAGQATAFLSAKLPLEPTLAFRVGGEKIWGKFPYFESAFIGDAETVRLGRSNRYAGDASVYGSTELRLRLARMKVIVPTDFGVFGLADAGRVFLEGENSDTWHRAFGGGVWLAPLDRNYTLSAAVAAGDERTGFYLQAGFAF